MSNFTKNPTIEKRNCTCSLVLSESCWYYIDTDNDGSACSSARHQMGLKTKKHDSGVRITSAQRLHSQTDSHAACYWQVLQLGAPQTLSAHCPQHLCFCWGHPRLGEQDPPTSILAIWPLGKEHSVRKPTLSGQVFISRTSPHGIRDVLLVWGQQRTPSNSFLE